MAVIFYLKQCEAHKMCTSLPSTAFEIFRIFQKWTLYATLLLTLTEQNRKKNEKRRRKNINMLHILISTISNSIQILTTADLFVLNIFDGWKLPLPTSPPMSSLHQHVSLNRKRVTCVLLLFTEYETMNNAIDTILKMNSIACIFGNYTLKSDKLDQ